ncbi:MAG: adenylate/guanylate cyclase domain-containing protein [Anaerolineales bacterium]
MTLEDHLANQKQLEQAIAVQESLRGTIDDAIIDTTIAALRKQLAEVLSIPPDSEQQRKMVTVLFMDIVNSTQMIQGIDPEVSMEILDVSLDALAEPIRKHGGHVNRFMGDGFLAVFGLPNARENDSEMAVRAALDILGVSEGIAQSLKKERGIQTFQVRVGIDTGLIAAGGVTESDDTIMGSTINLAARLEKAAEPGTILVSKHSYQHIRGIFEMEQQSPIEAKGFPEPVETYKILRVKSQAFRLMSRGVEGVETRMVGRRQEMQRAQEIARAAFEEKKCRFVTITGEAGIGKSRFLDEFENWLDLQPVQVGFFKGRATLETQNQPYALFRDMFAFRFEILDDDPVQVVRQKFSDGFQQAIQNGGKSELKAHLVGHLLGYDFSGSNALKNVLDNPQLMRDRAFQYLVTYFSETAKQLPIVIFLDDVHWADESSLDLISYLSEALTSLPVLFFVLSRPALFERREQWGRGEGFQTISLTPLSREQSEQLVEELLQKVENIPNTLRELIIEHAEGNPYYIEEIIRMLVEDGIIVKEEPAWRIQPNRISDLRIPSTLTGIIQARLDGLPNQERIVLQQASIVGRVFWDAAVTHINQGQALDETRIAHILESLQSREMVFQRQPSAFAEAAEYLFMHLIFREVTYETVLLGQRKKYHSLVANWLIGQHGDRVAEMSGLIANHLVKAGRSAEAVDYFQRAGEAAAAKYANEEAVDLYQQALKLTPEQDLEKRFAILSRLENVWGIIGDRVAQADVIDNLDLIAEQLVDQQKKADVLLKRTWFFYWTSNYPEMLDVAQRVIALSEHIAYPGLAQKALYALTWVHVQLGKYDIAEEQAQQALALALQAGDRTGEGNVHNVLGMIGMTQRYYAEAYEHIEKFLHIAREIDNKNRELTALNNMVAILVILGEYEAAREHGLQMLNLAIEVGDRVMESTAYINLAWRASAQEDWYAAKEYVLKGIVIKREIHQLDALAEGLVWLGHIEMGLDRPVDAEQAFRESLEIRRELEQEALEAESMSGLSRALLAQGNLSAAQDFVEKIIDYMARDENLSGAWEPMRIYWNCYQVFREAEDPRQEGFLKNAVENLKKMAEKIPDEKARERFLTNVPWHRGIMAEWELVRHKRDLDTQD